MIGHHLLDHFGGAADDETVALQLIESEIVTLARLAPLLVTSITPLIAFLDARFCFAGRIGDAKIAKNEQTFE